jgi:Tol biopolymer transport system component
LASNSELQRKLREGIVAARRGDRATARRLLLEVTDQDPNNKQAWLWLATSANTLSERRTYLQRVLAIDPENRTAQQALAQLDRTQTETTTTSSTGINPAIFLIVALVALAIVGALVVGSGILTPAEDDEPTPTPTVVVVAATQGPTSTPLPTATFIFNPTSRAPTLPPTFTPTFTPTATDPPLPSSTPFSLSEMELLLTSQELGEVEPMLYRLDGDGSNSTTIGAAFRDITYSLSGESIAFVRDVTYEDDGGTFPEVFVAPADNPTDATQVTELRTDIVASPSFSPEGEELVFVANLDGSEDIWYTTINGEGTRRLTENTDIIDRDPAWRPIPDSREIIFARNNGGGGDTEIHRMEIAEPGTEPEYLQLTAASGASYAPAWSPLGEQFTFISTRRSDADVFISEADGGGTVLLTQGDDSAEDRNPSFTPDGNFVVFTSNRLDDRFQTYIVSTDARVLQRITENEREDITAVYRPELILRIRQR